MANRTDMEFDPGDQDIARIRRALAILPERAGPLLGHGLLEAARVTGRAVRATSRFRDRSGRLRGSVVEQKTTARFPVLGGQWITVPGGGARVRVKAPHAYLVDQGHGGPHPAAGRRFVQHAVQSSRVAALAAFVDYMRRRVKDLAPHGL